MVDVTSYKLPASNIWQFMSFHYAVSVSFQTKKQEKSWFLFISHMQCMPTQHDNTSFIFLIYNIYSKKTETQIMKSLPFLPFKKKCILPSFHTVAEIKKPTLSAIALKVDHR